MIWNGFGETGKLLKYKHKRLHESNYKNYSHGVFLDQLLSGRIETHQKPYREFDNREQ